MKYSHLDLPFQWQHYWTKYPEGYTILEALITWVNQVNQMTDNLNSVNDYLEDFTKQFDDELRDTAIEVLTEWKNDGVLESIINIAILKDFALNVSGFENVKDAVAFANENKYDLHWGVQSREFIVSGNIEGFHDVVHTGNGFINTGDTIFYINPTDKQTNTIYCGFGGLATNDGLTPSRPVTVKKAVSILQGLGAKASSGQWVLEFVQGVCRENGVVLSDLPYFKKPLIIKGTKVGTTKLSSWDGSTSTAAYAIRAEGTNNHLYVEIQDMIFNNWTLSPSNAGALVFWDGVNVKTLNCEFDYCSVAVWCRSGASRHVGDVIRNCHWGYGMQYSHTGKIGSEDSPITISNCDIGIMCGRTSVVHSDYITYRNNEVDIQVAQKSRVATIGCHFNGWKDVSIWLMSDSIHEDNSKIRSIWEAGSVTDNTPIYRFDNGSAVPAVHIGSLPYRVAHYVPQNGYVMENTTEEVLVSGQEGLGSPLRIPKKLLYNGGSIELEIRCRITFNYSSGERRVSLRGPSGDSEYDIAVLTKPAGSAGTGTITFRVLFKPSGQVLTTSHYIDSAGEQVFNTKTVSSGQMDKMRDNTDDIAGWRIYAQSDNTDSKMTFWSISTYMYN